MKKIAMASIVLIFVAGHVKAQQAAVDLTQNPAKHALASELAKHIVLEHHNMEESQKVWTALAEQYLTPEAIKANPGKDDLVNSVLKKSYETEVSKLLSRSLGSTASVYEYNFSYDELKKIQHFDEKSDPEKWSEPAHELYRSAHKIADRIFDEKIGEGVQSVAQALKNNNLIVPDEFKQFWEPKS